MTTSAHISLSLTELKPHYTVVVVGSGYGAGVAASRLSRAGQAVCVLERGREFRPGEYPDTLANAQGNMQLDTARGKLGPADGLFNLHMNPDMLALVGCGLGGTSLINANVGLEIDPRLFDLEVWPAEFRSDKALLEQSYQRARAMLDINPYPDNFPTLNKLKALEMSAKAMGQPFYRPPIAVNFKDQTNPFGVAQPKCNGCGDCCSGCNVGAKNTTLMNYLPDARNHGAEIFTQARVEWIERDGDLWRVHVSPNGEDAPGTASSVTADIVMLGAGSLGSTEILLRSRENGLKLSDRLGKSFSGNGDVLAFGYDSYWQSHPASDGTPVPENLNAIGVGTNTVSASQYPGPCITGVIDMRNAEVPAEGLVIEEGTMPGAMATALAPSFFFANAMAGSFTKFGLDEIKPRLLDAKEMGNAFAESPGSLGDWAYKGPMARTQTYLVMSVDDAKGKLELTDDRLRINWPGAGSAPNIKRDNQLIDQAAGAISGQFFPSPIWNEALGDKVITVHPIGGCGMGDDATSGVVDHKCQVFAGKSGTKLHPGLYVCDGAAMPGAIGVNPLLTISAVAERACELLVQERGWQIDWTMAPSGPLPPSELVSALKDARTAALDKHSDLLGRIKHSLSGLFSTIGHGVSDFVHEELHNLVEHLESGAIDLAKKAIEAIIHRYPSLLSPTFQFTETMHGWVSLKDITSAAPPSERISNDFATSEAWGKHEGRTCDFELTIHSDDLNAMTSERTHAARIVGTVNCPGLSDTPMRVKTGTFKLLTIDTEAVETWRMSYDMVLERDAGPVRFYGFKVLRQQAGSNPWTDLTTLFITIHDGELGDGPLLARGILTLNLEDLAWQASSFQLEVKDDWAGHLVERFPRAKDAIATVYLAKFAGFFGMTVFNAYGGLLADLKNFPAMELAAEPSERPRRKLALPKAKQYTVELPDGFKNRLTRYQGGNKGPVLVAPGFSIRASSFALDTVDTNFAEMLVAAGYDVWLFDYRASPDSGNPLNPPRPFTIDDIALVDWPHAIDFVRKTAKVETVQAVSHCISSMSLLMSIAVGTEGVRSLVSSQLTLHPVTDWLNYMKADLDAVGLLSGLSQLNGTFNFSAGLNESETDYEIDAAAWMIPVVEGQACKNPTCRRVFAVYGPSYEHAQLNHWTHTTLSEMFGAVSIKPFEQLQTIIRLGHAVDADGKNRYLTDDCAKRLKLPISFISGSANQLFYPETAWLTQEWLAGINGSAFYTNHVFEGYAHMDTFIGRNAARDVFPYIIEELNKFNA
jgi:cholesterol oxidase